MQYDRLARVFFQHRMCIDSNFRIDRTVKAYHGSRGNRSHASHCITPCPVLHCLVKRLRFFHHVQTTSCRARDKVPQSRQVQASTPFLPQEGKARALPQRLRSPERPTASLVSIYDTSHFNTRAFFFLFSPRLLPLIHKNAWIQ